MPFFKLEHKIRLQARPNYFLDLGPGVVEVDDEFAQHGYLNLVGKRVDENLEEIDSEPLVVKADAKSTNDLNPAKAKLSEPDVTETVLRQPPAPLKPFGEGPKSLKQREAEAAAVAIKPQEVVSNLIEKSEPVKPQASEVVKPQVKA